MKTSWEEMLPGLLNLLARDYLVVVPPLSAIAKIADRQEAAVEEERRAAEANEVAQRAAMEEQQ